MLQKIGDDDMKGYVKILLAVMVLGLLFAGCGKDTAKPAENANYGSSPMTWAGRWS